MTRAERRRRLAPVIPALAFALVALPIDRATALAPAPFRVTKTADTNDGACNGDCSLREAVVAANAQVGDDVIRVPSGTYRLTRTTAGENAATTGDLDITGAVTIRGAGAANTVIKGLNADRVFEIRSGGSATITRLTVRGGNPGNDVGGGILSSDDLTLRNVVVSSNTANSGGGIFNQATLTITHSLITDNTTVSGVSNPEGAGLRTSGPTTILSSTFSLNKATGNGARTGGAIDVHSTSLTVRNSTIVKNAALNGGGINSTNATLTLNNDTIAQNTVLNAGGGISHFSFDGTRHVTMGNSILAANSPGNCQLTADTLDSQGHNLDTGTSCGLDGAGDRSNTPAGLTALARNGGPTPTMALSPGSVARNHGGSGCEAGDQRGVKRPQGSACDIGAYEMAVAKVTKPQSSTLHHRTFTVAWTAPRRGAASFDVRFRRRPLGGSFGPFHAFRTDTTTRSASFTGDFGFQFCFSARAIDKGGHPATFGTERCVKVTH